MSLFKHRRPESFNLCFFTLHIITATSRAAFLKAVNLVQIKTHWSNLWGLPVFDLLLDLFFRRPRLPRRCTVVPSGLHHISTSRDAVSLGLATNSVIPVWLFCQQSSVCQESKSTVPFWINIVLTRYLFRQSTQSQTLEGLLELTRCPSRAPKLILYVASWSFRDTRTLSGLWHKGRRSQDAVKSNRHTPWLCIWRKYTFFICTFESWLLKANRIEMG